MKTKKLKCLLSLTIPKDKIPMAILIRNGLTNMKTMHTKVWTFRKTDPDQEGRRIIAKCRGSLNNATPLQLKKKPTNWILKKKWAMTINRETWRRWSLITDTYISNSAALPGKSHYKYVCSMCLQGNPDVYH